MTAPVVVVQKGRKLLILLLFIGLLGSGGLLGLNSWWQQALAPAAASGQGQVVEIKPADSVTELARRLQQQGLIKSALAFRWYGQWQGLDRKVKPGPYLLAANLSVPEIWSALTSGKVATVKVTIPEGYTLAQMAELLEKKGLVQAEEFLQAASQAELPYDYWQPGNLQGPQRLEGYLFPATYDFPLNTKAEEIIRIMAQRMAAEITPEFVAKARALGLTPAQAITLASIIEREVKVDRERPKVAAVFLNRLRQGMKLESCATVQYALGKPRARLYYKDLEVASPYNTYKIKGLPPGPIAAPGHASLQAAVNPAAADYLYFVVSRNGEHAFSRTWAEHLRNKAKYLANLDTPLEEK
ncbi:UPF0755 protein [Carboxydocella thermautotrophica]|nr:UPF0755 protein [Carboxydocella thermautotrophica]